MDIGPGDWVECVRPSELRPGALTVGAIYRVVWVHHGPFEDGSDGLGLEVDGAPSISESGWRCDRFRPIYRPRESLFRDLLAPVDLVSA